MYFKKTRCTGCESSFDEMLDYCPFCGRKNNENSDFKRRHPLTFIPWYLELTLALLGLIGFQLFALVFSIVFAGTYQEDEGRGLMLLNVCSYLAFFLVVFLLLFINSNYRKDIFNKFKIPLAYMWAGIGFGVLIAFSITYGNIVEMIFPDIGEGANQTAVNNMVLSYPLISILVVGIIGPICEEAAYRIGLFTLLRRVHPSLAYIGTAIVFGLIHFDFFNSDMLTEIVYLQNYIFAGLCFSFIYDKKGIAASTLAHISNNMFSIFAILLASQIV